MPLCHLLLIIIVNVLARLKFSVYACGITRLSSYARNSTLTDDVIINISHPAMKTHVDLVEGLRYNVTLSGEPLTTSSCISLVIHTDDQQTASTQENHTNSISTDISNNYPNGIYPDDIVEVIWHNDGARVTSQLSLSWTSPGNSSCTCFYMTAVIQVPGLLLTSWPYALCKPRVCRHYYNAPSGRFLYNNSNSIYKDAVNCSFIIIGGSNFVIEMEFEYLELEAIAGDKCGNTISIFLGGVIETEFCGKLTSQELLQRKYVTSSDIVHINLAVVDINQRVAFLVAFSIQENEPMCTQRLDANGHETTLGQRMLKEPIWIGLIVILSVVMVIAIIYVIRKKCGRYFSCCEVKISKADDNILNSDGTITLNSFPLRKMTRPSRLSIISTTSPSSPRSTTTTYLQNETPMSTPGIKVWDAAATFFAAYKDTERSLVSVPLTTDFSKTTDTSLSQTTGDATIGAVVGGTLQLDLHIRENKEHSETMTRARSLPQMADKSNTIIRHSYSSEHFPERLQTRLDDLSQTCRPDTNGDKQVTRDLNHIYPHVIVQSPNVVKQSLDTDGYGNERTHTKVPDLYYIDSSGAHVIQVEIDDNSEDTDDCDVSNSETDSDTTWAFRNHSADSGHALELVYNDAVFRNSQNYNNCCDSTSTRNTDLGQRKAESTSMFIKNEFSRRNCYRKHVTSRSTPCIPQRDMYEPDRTCRTYSLMEGHADVSRVNRRHDRILVKTKRMDLSSEDAAGIEHHHRPSLEVSNMGNITCSCPTCLFNRSESVTSNMSSSPRDGQASRHKVTRITPHKDKRRRRETSKLRSTSTSSDQISKHSKRRRSGSSCSHRHKHLRIKQSSSVRSLSTAKFKCGSSTDSDLIKSECRPGQCISNDDTQCGNKKLSVSQSTRDTPTTSTSGQLPSPRNPDVKDLFRQVFSQEIDLDDLYIPPQDDIDFKLSSKPNSKESFLASEPLYNAFQKNHNRDEPDTLSRDGETDNVIDEDDTNKSTYPTSIQTQYSVVTMLAGSSEVTPVSKHSSVEAQHLRDTITSSASSGTPTTCNVIVYDSNIHMDNYHVSPSIKPHFRLTRKHSSLDLVEPTKYLHLNQHLLRTASSMQELYHVPQTEDDIDNKLEIVNEQRWLDSDIEYVTLQTFPESVDTDFYIEPHTSHPPHAGLSNMDVEMDDLVEKNFWTTGREQKNNIILSQMSSPENMSPQNKRAIRKPNHTHPTFSSIQYLSVTDTDSAMSSAPSPQATPLMYQIAKTVDPAYRDPIVKDSAYQTKQSSMETETITEIRIRRPFLPAREEDRKVTQRLHQAALKLLVMQQRLRRTRQLVSKDSAVNTISEDDATFDDLAVTSSKTRAFKPGVLYPASLKDDFSVQEFSPLQCCRIVEEHDAMIEYEV